MNEIKTYGNAQPKGLRLITLKTFADSRGFFRETYRENAWNEIFGRDVKFIQDNESLSLAKGVLRGLHFQKAPQAQAKLVRALTGSIFDVAVDLRQDSPTFGKWQAYELSAENAAQLFIPAGFAHGFCTLEENVLVNYKVDAYYAPDRDAGILWNDPEIGIDWPLDGPPVISDKDAALPSLRDFCKTSMLLS